MPSRTNPVLNVTSQDSKIMLKEDFLIFKTLDLLTIFIQLTSLDPSKMNNSRGFHAWMYLFSKLQFTEYAMELSTIF